jgi:hypothetical protein
MDFACVVVTWVGRYFWFFLLHHLPRILSIYFLLIKFGPLLVLIFQIQRHLLSHSGTKEENIVGEAWNSRERKQEDLKQQEWQRHEDKYNTRIGRVNTILNQVLCKH